MIPWFIRHNRKASRPQLRPDGSPITRTAIVEGCVAHYAYRERIEEARCKNPGNKTMYCPHQSKIKRYKFSDWLWYHFWQARAAA